MSKSQKDEGVRHHPGNPVHFETQCDSCRKKVRLASNLNRLGVDDSIIQSILRHSTVATTQNHYIKTVRPDAVAAMRQLSDALLCSR